MIERVGKIKSTYLGFEDHGIFTFWLDFDFGGSGQGFGTICMGTYSKAELDVSKIRYDASSLDLIKRVIEVCGVDNWENIKGKTMFALYNKEDGMIEGIKQLPFDGNSKLLLSDWRKRWNFPE